MDVSHLTNDKNKIDAPVELKTELIRTDRGLWRDLTAYWLLGLCNNYGYVVMLSAAHDIIHQFHGEAIIRVSFNSKSFFYIQPSYFYFLDKRY